MKNKPLATGRVEALCINGKPVEQITFAIDGPINDDHRGFFRRLSGHDGDYKRTSSLLRGHEVFNWRSWTGLSKEELVYVESSLACTIPPGTLLENITFSDIPNFSTLPPTSRLVFPYRPRNTASQCILAVWEQNGPCKTVGERVAEHNRRHDLTDAFVRAAKGRRGVMGLVLAAGTVQLGDTVIVYPPVT